MSGRIFLAVTAVSVCPSAFSSVTAKLTDASEDTDYHSLHFLDLHFHLAIRNIDHRKPGFLAV